MDPGAASRRPDLESPTLGFDGNVGDHNHLPRRIAAPLSERRDYAPLKGDIFDTADTGQIIKARIDAYHEENPSGSRPPFFQVTATEI